MGHIGLAHGAQNTVGTSQLLPLRGGKQVHSRREEGSAATVWLFSHFLDWVEVIIRSLACREASIKRPKV